MLLANRQPNKFGSIINFAQCEATNRKVWPKIGVN